MNVQKIMGTNILIAGHANAREAFKDLSSSI